MKLALEGRDTRMQHALAGWDARMRLALAGAEWEYAHEARACRGGVCDVCDPG